MPSPDKHNPLQFWPTYYTEITVARGAGQRGHRSSSVRLVPNICKLSAVRSEFLDETTTTTTSAPAEETQLPTRAEGADACRICCSSFLTAVEQLLLVTPESWRNRNISCSSALALAQNSSWYETSAQYSPHSSHKWLNSCLSCHLSLSENAECLWGKGCGKGDVILKWNIYRSIRAGSPQLAGNSPAVRHLTPQILGKISVMTFWAPQLLGAVTPGPGCRVCVLLICIFRCSLEFMGEYYRNIRFAYYKASSKVKKGRSFPRDFLCAVTTELLWQLRVHSRLKLWWFPWDGY